jgi:hypothetical protein
MRSNRPDLVKQVTDVLDEIIPGIPVDDRTSALVARIGKCILKAAAEEQASYETLLAAASAEMGAISKERTNKSFIPDAHGAQSMCDEGTVDAIPVPVYAARSLVPWESTLDVRWPVNPAQGRLSHWPG